MEIPTEYKSQDAEMPYVEGFLETRPSHDFLDLVAATVNAMIISGMLETGAINDEEVIEMAIAIIDKLIEKVGGGCEQT
jgi:hypothetical protein